MRRTATGRRCIAACRREGGRRGGSRPGDGDVRYGTVRWVKKSEFFSRLGGRLESVGEEDGRACVRALRCVRGDGSIRSTDERGEREKEKKETLRGRRFARASAALLLCFEETRSMRKRTKNKKGRRDTSESAHTYVHGSDRCTRAGMAVGVGQAQAQAVGPSTILIS